MQIRPLRGRLVASSVAAALAFGPATGVVSAAPWDILGIGQKVEADPQKSYELTDRQGPWLILASTFRGEGARADAIELLQELRRDHNLESYLYKVEFDYSQRQTGLGFNDEFDANGNPQPRRMRNLNNAEVVEEFAVMVGNFASVDDPRLDPTLDRIKHLHPQCLTLAKGETTTRTFFDLRAMQDKLNLSSKTKGPLRTAFTTRNPLLPEEYFATKGVSALVEQMNADVQYSLLDCPGLYTVKVATFRGKHAFSLEKDFDQLAGSEVSDALHKAAVNAHNMTIALRKKGVEAYEFHDVDSSIVTVGAFQELGRPLSEGRVEMDKKIYDIIEVFKPAASGNAAAALMPKDIDGIPFDVQPWPMDVPKRSLASSYTRR